ncbi:MAG: hypothetical protein ACRDIB_02565 [Ardenticatenaceae bacterium]
MNDNSTLQERVAMLEGIVGQMNERLNSMDANITGLRADMNSYMGRIEARIDRLESRFLWMFGIMMALQAVIVGGLLAAILTG